MCGDLDDDTKRDDELLAWLTANAKVHDAAPGEPAASGQVAPGAPGSNEYMSWIFRGALTRALSDIAAAAAGARADAIGSQAIVLARLAGFLAGHLPPESDIFRNLIDALVDGNREPEQAAGRGHADHQPHHGTAGDDHHHGHGHDH